MSNTSRQASDLSHSLLHVGAWADMPPCTDPLLGPDGLSHELELLSGKGKDDASSSKNTSSTKKTSSSKKAKGSKSSTHKGTNNKPAMSTWLQEHYESPWTPYQAAATFDTANNGQGGAAHASDPKSAGANTPTAFQG